MPQKSQDIRFLLIRTRQSPAKERVIGERRLWSGQHLPEPPMSQRFADLGLMVNQEPHKRKRYQGDDTQMVVTGLC